jgi:hypothetical protein
MKPICTVGTCLSALIVTPGAAAGTAGGPLPPITLTEAGVDAQRHPFADTRPSRRYWVQTGSYGVVEDGPEPAWRGDYPLIPGVYYTAIQGDAPFQGGMPWTPSKRFRVKARQGEWTGPTSQKRYIRFTRPRPKALRGVRFSIYGRGGACEAHASFLLPRPLEVREDGSFSGRFKNVWDVSRQSTADVRIAGRLRRSFARGVLRVDNLFEGCRSGRVTWSARRR